MHDGMKRVSMRRLEGSESWRVRGGRRTFLAEGTASAKGLRRKLFWRGGESEEVKSELSAGSQGPWRAPGSLGIYPESRETDSDLPPLQDLAAVQGIVWGTRVETGTPVRRLLCFPRGSRWWLDLGDSGGAAEEW